jgi:hypothetical protein
MGKSSSQVVGYRYNAKFAAFIGNRIEKLIGINFDNRKWIVHDPLKHPPNLLPVLESNLFGENEGGVSGQIDMHFGYPDQEPNATYKQYFPLVSGYPYQSYLVFHSGSDNKGFYLGNSGYMKEMLLWVKRTRVRNDGRGQWYEFRGDGAVVCEIGGINSANTSYYPNANFEIHAYIDYQNVYGRFDYQRNLQITNFAKEGGLAWEFGPVGTSSGAVSTQLYVEHRFVGDTPCLLRIVMQVTAIEICGEPTITVSSEKGIFLSKDIFENEGSEAYDFNVVIEWACPNGFDVKIRTLSNPVYQKDLEIFVNGLSIDETDLFLLPLINYSETKIVCFDINPIHKIREILTDDTAMSKPESDVNDVNFVKAADRIYDEALGISWAIDEKSCIEAIEELCYHIEAGIRVNRQTGLYEMVLFRDDWFSNDEVHDIAENKIKDLSLEVMNSDDIVNQLNVTYYDRERIKNSTFSVYENGSILTMGHANAESVEFPYFMNMRNAEIVANWKLKQFSTPAWSGSFTTGWKEARKWNRYDLIRLPWSSKWNGTILVRIMKINLGNGADNTVTIDFEEVIPYSGEMNTSIVADESMSEGVIPPQPSINAVFEAPYYLTVLRTGQTNADLELSNNPDIGYVAAIAAKPQSNSLNALLYTDGGAGEFEQVSRLDYCDILQLDQSIAETTSSFMVTGSLTQTANSNNLILLNDELMGFVSFDTETKVLTVKRGALDTIPKKHNSGNLFVFDLPDVAFDSTQYAQSEMVEAQVLTTTPSGIQELSASGTSVEIQSRAIRPYPPANVRINGEYWLEEIETDLIITWVDRNRLQQTGGTPLSWFDSSVNIEPNTQTYLILSQLDENQIELATSNANVTGATSYTMPILAMQADTRFVKITLKTARDGYECLNPFMHTVELSQFFSAPYDLTVEFKND